MFYSNSIFAGPNATLYTNITYSVQVVVTFFCGRIIGKYGRRNLLIYGMIICIITMGSLTYIFMKILQEARVCPFMGDVHLHVLLEFGLVPLYSPLGPDPALLRRWTQLCLLPGDISKLEIELTDQMIARKKYGVYIYIYMGRARPGPGPAARDPGPQRPRARARARPGPAHIY